MERGGGLIEHTPKYRRHTYTLREKGQRSTAVLACIGCKGKQKNAQFAESSSQNQKSCATNTHTCEHMKHHHDPNVHAPSLTKWYHYLRRIVGQRNSCGQSVEVVPPVCLSRSEPHAVYSQADRRVTGSLGPVFFFFMRGCCEYFCTHGNFGGCCLVVRCVVVPVSAGLGGDCCSHCCCCGCCCCCRCWCCCCCCCR